MHAGRFGDFAGCAVDDPVGEHVADIDGVFTAIGDDADNDKARRASGLRR
jgi:hypothetical protein